jgi:hypothetical protein
LTIKELQLGTEAAWKYCYSFRSIARRIAHSPAPWPVRIGTNLGYRFYAHNLSRFYNCDWMIGRAQNVPRHKRTSANEALRLSKAESSCV